MRRLLLPLALSSAAQAPGAAPDLGGTPQLSQQPATQDTPAQGAPSIPSSLGPLGDPGGLRAALARRGVT